MPRKRESRQAQGALRGAPVAHGENGGQAVRYREVNIRNRGGDVIEGDEYDAVIKVFEQLLAPSTASGFSVMRPTMLSTCVDAAHRLLTCSYIAEILESHSTSLLRDVDAKALHAQGMARKLTCSAGSTGVAETTHEGSGEGSAATRIPELVISLLFEMDHDERADAADAYKQPNIVGLSFDAPQWFSEDDSDSDDSMQAGLQLQSADEHESSPAKDLDTETPIPQWFEDVDDEEQESDVQLVQYELEDDLDIY